MVRFRYGNVFMEIEKASEKARSILRRALTVRDEKSGVPYCLVDDHRFLTGLAERAYAALSEAGIAYRVADQPEFGDITQLTVPDDLLEDVVLYPEYQVQAVIKALHWKRGVAILPTGSGKCLGLGTKVLLYSGRTVRVEDICEGDLLMGPDSKPRRVLSTTRGRGPLYRIEPLRGEPWVCNDAHILTLVHTTTGEVRDVPLQEWLSSNKTFKHEWKQFGVGVDFPPQKKPLPIDPYFLGLWFGDGRKNLDQGVQISKPDVEVRDACAAVARQWGLFFRVDNDDDTDRCPNYRLVVAKGQRNPLLDQLRLTVRNGRVPHAYLRAARHERLAFLAGWLDTDGYHYKGYFEIVQRNKSYARAVCFLARSLGFCALLSEKWVNDTCYWRVSITGDLSEIPTRIPRKRAFARRQIKSATRTGFNVAPIGRGVYAGFTLDGDGRFLLGDFTVTHNTEIAAAIAKLLQEREGLSTMMIVPGINSMHQTWRRWTRRGLEGVGRLGGGIVELDGAEHVITVLDSLRQRLEGGDRQLRKFLRGCGCVIFMEAQHLPADTWMDVGAKLDMPYRIGLSATPYLDEDGPHAVRDLQLIGSTAETVIEIPDSLVMNLGRMSTPVVHFVETTGDWMGGEKNWHRLRRDGIVDNRERNRAAVRCASRLAKRGRKVIMLATEIPHGRKLATEISKKGVENVFMFQGQSKFTTFRRGTTYRTERKPIYDVADALEELDDYVLVGSPAVDEDADFPDADVLINCSGGRAMGRLVQRVGRVLRAKPEKGNIAHVIDFDDKCAFVLRAHSRRRREIYEARYDGADKFRIFDHEIPDGAVDAVLA